MATLTPATTRPADTRVQAAALVRVPVPVTLEQIAVRAVVVRQAPIATPARVPVTVAVRAVVVRQAPVATPARVPVTVAVRVVLINPIRTPPLVHAPIRCSRNHEPATTRRRGALVPGTAMRKTLPAGRVRHAPPRRILQPQEPAAMAGTPRDPITARKTPDLPVAGILMGMVVNPHRPKTKTRQGVLTGHGTHPQNPSIPNTPPNPGTPHQKPTRTRNTTPNNPPARSNPITPPARNTRMGMVRGLLRGRAPVLMGRGCLIRPRWRLGMVERFRTRYARARPGRGSGWTTPMRM